MASTIGQQLREARKKKGLSIEDVAHTTRIHANSIRALEADDYSGFASITYAKSFLQLYSRNLNVDASEALAVFQGTGSIDLHSSPSGLGNINDTVESFGPSERSYRQVKRKRNKGKPGGAPIFLGMILGVLVIAIPVFYFLGYNAENPEDVKEEILKNAKQISEEFKGLNKGKGESNGTSVIQPNPLSAKGGIPVDVEANPGGIPEEPAEKGEGAKKGTEPGSLEGGEEPIATTTRPNGVYRNGPVIARPVDPNAPKAAVGSSKGEKGTAETTQPPIPGPPEPEELPGAKSKGAAKASAKRPPGPLRAKPIARPIPVPEPESEEEEVVGERPKGKPRVPEIEETPKSAVPFNRGRNRFPR